MMANLPVLAGPDLLDEMYDGAFAVENYKAPAKTDGPYRLMAGSLEADWGSAIRGFGGTCSGADRLA